MYPSGLLSFVVATCSAVALALPGPSIDIAKKSADIKLNENDPLFTKYGLNKSAEYKYFHEPGRDDILGHYDIRYFNGTVSDEERAVSLTHMTRAYLNFFRENNLETWIAHGTLLGWWWNGKVRILRFPLIVLSIRHLTDMELGYRSYPGIGTSTPKSWIRL